MTYSAEELEALRTAQRAAASLELRALLRIAAAKAATAYLERVDVDREEERRSYPLTFGEYESRLEGWLFADLEAAAAGDLDSGGNPGNWEPDEWTERDYQRAAAADEAYDASRDA